MKKRIVSFIGIAVFISACGQQEPQTQNIVSESATSTSDVAALEKREVGVSIYSPLNGAKILANTSFSLDYEVQPSPDGDHVQITVDKQDPIILNQFQGQYSLAGLAPGEHVIQVREINSNNHPTGKEDSIYVVVE
jgi:hypothetical protein